MVEELTKKKESCDRYLESKMEELWEISKYIHANPELCFTEVKACTEQCKFLEKYGFQVENWILLTVRLFPMIKKDLL